MPRRLRLWADLRCALCRAMRAAWVVSVLGLGLSQLPGHAASLTATLDRNVVPVGESVTLSLIFEGVQPGGRPNLPALPNIKVAPGVGQRSEFTFINGRQSARQIFDYTLIPSRAGDITIPAIPVRVGNQMLATQPLLLKVVPSGAPGTPGATMTNLAFLRLVVPKNDVYVGEPFPVEIQLYWQNARDIQRPQLQAEGFSLGQPADPTQTRTQVGGVIYNVAVFRLAATAAKTGAVNLGPAECGLTVLVPINTPRRRNDPFWDPFDIFGPRAQARPATLLSETVTMNVLPLPAVNIPPSFNGAVGSFTLNFSAGPTELAVGDPLTVKVQIMGNGRIDALALPEQPQWKDFKVYPPTASVETRDPLGLAGAKSFTQVVIPQNHEIRELPPLRFTFFDPGARTYCTLNSPATPLKVHPSAGGSTPPPVLASNAPPNAPLPVDDIVNIKTHLADRTPLRPLLAYQPSFMGLQAVPLLAWLFLLIWRKRKEALANNPRLRRQREVARKIRDGLRDLTTQASARHAEDFFATLFRLLQEQIGERLDLPASAITEAVVDDRLRGRNLAEATVSTLHDLFQTCNAARYAPAQTRQELEALIPKLESVIRELQSWNP